VILASAILVDKQSIDKAQNYNQQSKNSVLAYQPDMGKGDLNLKCNVERGISTLHGEGL